MLEKLKTELRQRLLRWSTPIYCVGLVYAAWGFMYPAYFASSAALALGIYLAWLIYENPIKARMKRRKEYYAEEEKGNVPKVH